MNNDRPGGFNNVDFFFAPGGEPLGSSGAPSMPEEIGLGVENPMTALNRRMAQFTRGAEAKYGLHDPNNTLYDPRGVGVLKNPSDYYEANELIPAPEFNLDAAGDRVLNGGAVMEGQAMPPQTPISRDFLERSGAGLSPAGAHQLQKALEVQKQSVAGTLRLASGQVKTDFVGESGLASNGFAGLPTTFESQGGTPQALTDDTTLASAVNRSLLAKAPSTVKSPDANGVVDNYASGTGPYDSPASDVPFSAADAKPGTTISNGVFEVQKSAAITAKANATQPMGAAPSAGVTDFATPDAATASNALSTAKNSNAPVYGAPGDAYAGVGADGYMGSDSYGGVTNVAQENANGIPWAHILGFGGAALLGAWGITKLVKGAQA